MAKSAPGNLGPYRLLNVVHTGHGCQLWQAYDDVKQRVVGVKILREDCRKDKEQLRYLRQEYVVGHNLVHPTIVQMFALDEDRGTIYLAMEWFAYPNMKQRILAGVDKVAPLASKIIEQSADSLAYFHRKGWIHRDIKPDNFLLADDGSVKLIDFALARRKRGGLTRWLMPSDKVQGTKSYMSPEQIRASHVDERSDLYSLACTYFELLTGKPPFTGASSNELLMKHLRVPPPVLEAVNQNITPEFGQLLRRCLAKDPKARPKTVGDFLTEFRMIRLFRTAPTANLCKSPACKTDVD